MAKHGKKFRDTLARVDRQKYYSSEEAIALCKSIACANFDETVDVAFHLNVNPRHADQMVRGAVTLPHGTGKTVRIAVFAKGEKATEAQEAGADIVGAEDLVARVTDGFLDFDVTVATPDMMGQVGRIGRVLGPRGLMPNPKAGTVTFDVGRIVKELKAGRIEIRSEKHGGVVHVPIGKVSFTEQQLVENLHAVTEMLARHRPASAKAPYFRSISLSPTMGPGIKVDTSFASQML